MRSWRREMESRQQMTDITDDTALTLNEACRIFFRDAIKPASLRAEARRGNLTLLRIGKRDFVTPAAIREMKERCQVHGPKVLASGSSQPAQTRTVALKHLSGSSATTEDLKRARAALHLTAQKLNDSLPNTSRKNTNPRKGTVIPLSSTR